METSGKPRVGPLETLDRFFQQVRQQAATDPAFADRLIRALNVTVYYEGEDALKASNPVLLSGMRDAEGFSAIYNVPAFKVGDLKRLILSNDLATPTDLKAKRTKPQLIDFMYQRAADKRRELRAD